MTKERLILILKELGINTNNCYTKKSFYWNDKLSIGCYPRELKEDFYFHNHLDDKIYFISAANAVSCEFDVDLFNGSDRYIVPLEECSVIYPVSTTCTTTKYEMSEEIEKLTKQIEEKPFEELEDSQFAKMTLRDYACIHLKVAETDKGWLNEIIKKATPGSKLIINTEALKNL